MKKWKKITYWVATVWLCSGLLATGVQQLMKVQLDGVHSPPGVYGITALGYPVYLLTLLGVWKILGVVALLIPKFPLLKEWAYAGTTFLLTGAIFSHLAVGNAAMDLFPASLLLLLTLLSWYYRPPERRMKSEW